MIKRITLLRRREDLTEDAFRTHWAKPHAAIALGFEGLARYNQNRVDRVLWQDGPDALQVDGIVELWFESQDAVIRNGTSDTTRALIEDEPRFLSGLTALDAGPRPMPEVDGADCKVLLLCCGTDGAKLATAIEKAAAALPADIAPLAHALDSAALMFTREALWAEPVPPDTAATFWLRDPVQADALFGDPGTPLRAAFAGAAGSTTGYLVDELRIV